MPNAPTTFRLHGVPRQGKSREAAERCKKYRTKAWEQIRLAVIARDGMQCQICGDICTGKGQAHCDHIVAVVDGGSDDIANLRCLCVRCHSARTARDNATGAKQ